MRGALAGISAGALTVLGFAPFYLFPVPLLTLAWLFRRSNGKPRDAARDGFFFGLGLFGAGVSWIYVSLHDFGGLAAPLAAAATLLFCAFLALFPAAAGYLAARAACPVPLRAALLAPVLWVLMEWVRGWIFTGFPWLALGYSQTTWSPLAGFGPLLGVYGVSLATALAAGLLSRGAGRWAAFPFSVPGMVALLLLSLGAGLRAVEWTQPQGPVLTVSLAQGNIPQDLKWNPAVAQVTMDTYLAQARAAQGRLVVLPETAFPMWHSQLPPGYLAELSRDVTRRGGDILFGVPDSGGERYYNAVFSHGASPSQSYRKVHLVPFGEFIPFKEVLGVITDYLRIPLSDFSAGTPDQRPLEVAGQKVAVNICYEDVFGEEIIRQLPEATLLVNVSNDAWFGDSIAPWQHFQISQMRALETGRPMLRATNTGVTGIIDARGGRVKRLEPFTAGVLEGHVQGHTGTTPFVRWGNGAALLLLAALGGYALWRGRQDPGWAPEN